MEIQKFIDDFFFNKGKFSTSEGVCISNNTLEWCKPKGLDLHYELQKNANGTFSIRLDCHLFPYNELHCDATKLDAYYSTQKAAEVRERKKALTNVYRVQRDTQSIKYHGQNDCWWLAKSEIPADATKEEVIANVFSFIAQTYPFLIKNLTSLKIIDEK